MSLAAAIQVMWVLQNSTWESKCGSQTRQPASQSESSSHEVHDRRLKSVCIYKHVASIPGSTNAIWLFSMGNNLLHIWILSFQSPSQNAYDTDSVLNWLNIDKKPCQTLKRWFLWRWTWDTVNCWSVWTSFYPGMPATPSEARLVMGGAPWSATPPPWTKLARITGEAVQSIEVAFFSAVIREFKHSTSLQDDTSLNSPFYTPSARPRHLILWQALPSDH